MDLGSILDEDAFNVLELCGGREGRLPSVFWSARKVWISLAMRA